MNFSAELIEKLRRRVKSELSESRYIHTLGVAETAVDLSEFCLPENSSELEVAALLHDITKEYTHEQQIEIIRKNKLCVSDDDLQTSQILHSFTAKTIVQQRYPEFATVNVLSAVYNHTFGAPDMTVFDEIIFLSDFIEKNRRYDASVQLRKYVYENMKVGCTDANINILHIACINSIDSTISHLKETKRKINNKNILTRNALLSKI